MPEDSKDEKHEFPRWEELYQQQEVESMPWFNPELDEDLEKALEELGLQSGRALDLGTGPGTQAIHLAQLGFTVTATDISEAAIHLAREKAHKLRLEITSKSPGCRMTYSTLGSTCSSILFLTAGSSTSSRLSGGKIMSGQSAVC